MASLKNIMNTEDDQVDSSTHKSSTGSAPRFPIHPESSASSSTYIPPSHQSTTPLVHDEKASSINHPSPSLAAEASLSSSSSGITSPYQHGGRINNMMDRSYGNAHSGPSSLLSRPYGSGTSTHEMHRKLTPITKRPSKAKKGIPVHRCENCNPPKTFTRAEHLRRHQLSHQPASLPCNKPGCDKVFHRKDLLERHQQRHDQEDKPAQVGNKSGRTTKPPSPKYPGQPSRELQEYPNPSYDQMRHQTWPPVGGNPVPISQPPLNPSSMPTTTGSYQRPCIVGGMAPLPSEVDQYPIMYNQNPIPVPPMMFEPHIPSWHGSPIIASSPSDCSNSTGNLFSNRSPSTGWDDQFGGYLVPGSSPSPVQGGYHSTYVYPSSPEMYQSATYGNDYGLPITGIPDENTLYDPSLTVRNLPTELAMVQSSETLVATPLAQLSEGMISPSACGRHPAEMFGPLLVKDAAPLALDRATRQAIPKYLEVYWEKVNPRYPFIHKYALEESSDVSEEHRDILQCAMAAVATQFCEEKEHRVRGANLYAYAMHKSKMAFQTTEDSSSRSIMQAIVLCEYYGRFRGRKNDSYRSSSRFESLYQRVANNQNPFTPHQIGRDGRIQWKMWIDMESRRRLLAACFLLDIHGSICFEQPPRGVPGLDYSSPSTLPIPLTANTTEAWQARSWREWYETQAWQDLQAVNTTDLESLTDMEIASGPAFDASILLAVHGLQLMKPQDANRMDLAMSGASSQPEFHSMVRLFETSGIANTYLALSYVPLHCLLSVSGDSWLFNKKVSDARVFRGHQSQLSAWRQSSSSAVATVFAARALKSFFNLGAESIKLMEQTETSRVVWGDISDYWGVYISALVCWAFSYGGRRNSSTVTSRGAAVQWILTVAEMQPQEAREFCSRHGSHGVVDFVRDVLSRDCVGGRNILFEDAVAVLRRLSE